jgi:Fe-S-cluster-containing hydrogenase component 2
MGIDTAARKVIKCDLCDGDPMCVKFCETKALQFLDESQAKMAKMRLATTGLSELIRKFAIQ